MLLYPIYSRAFESTLRQNIDRIINYGNKTLQDATNLRDWIGTEQLRTETIGPKQCELMATTFGLDVPGLGAELPLPWHWAWFNEAKPPSELGRDGHPRKGGFIPPITLPRRMWAGGEVDVRSPIRIGRKITRRSVIDDIVEKSGRSGPLCILTLRHEYLDEDAICIVDKQNLVYREDPIANSPSPQFVSPPEGGELKKRFTPDSVLMFRYSALTFNGHRIHYDVDYARDVEGYRGLVFHAPLTATFLLQLAEELLGAAPSRFNYRATTPLFCGEEITFWGSNVGTSTVVWAQNEAGSQAMIAEASL